VPPDERIATFDNDGTLWVEQPYYTQLAFALDRIRALAPEHPEWREQQPLKAVLENDVEALKPSGIKGVMQLVMASHAGMTTEEFETIVEDWIASSEHPKFARPYTELVYQPMLELLAYLRNNGFKTFIVSGGGVEFMRPWTEQIYGIPPEQVVGSTILTEFALQDGVPVLVRRPEMDFLDDKEGKPVAITSSSADGRSLQQALGRRSADAAMDHRDRRPPAWSPRSSRRCRARVRLRSRQQHRSPRPGARPGVGKRLGGRVHEGRLQAIFLQDAK
jgi:hypothetical protein